MCVCAYIYIDTLYTHIIYTRISTYNQNLGNLILRNLDRELFKMGIHDLNRAIFRQVGESPKGEAGWHGFLVPRWCDLEQKHKGFHRPGTFWRATHREVFCNKKGLINQHRGFHRQMFAEHRISDWDGRDKTENPTGNGGESILLDSDIGPSSWWST